MAFFRFAQLEIHYWHLELSATEHLPLIALACVKIRRGKKKGILKTLTVMNENSLNSTKQKFSASP